MLRAKIYFDLHRECVLSDLTREAGRPFDVSWEEVHDDETFTAVLYAGDDLETARERLDASPQVSRVEAIDDRRLLLTKRACGALPVIRSNHGMLAGVDRVNGSRRVFDVVIFRRADLRAIVSELRELGTVRIGALTPSESATASLSPRQAEVVQAALEAGYFDWPRRVDAETLAARLDVTHPTLLEHLRKAEKKLLEESVNRAGTPYLTPPDEREFIRAGQQ